MPLSSQSGKYEPSHGEPHSATSSLANGSPARAERSRAQQKPRLRPPAASAAVTRLQQQRHSHLCRPALVRELRCHSLHRPSLLRRPPRSSPLDVWLMDGSMGTTRQATQPVPAGGNAHVGANEQRTHAGAVHIERHSSACPPWRGQYLLARWELGVFNTLLAATAPSPCPL